MVSQHGAEYRPEVTELTARAFDLMWRVYEGYSSQFFDEEELRASVRVNITLAVDVIGRGVIPPTALQDAGSLGRRRATQLVPLESVIQAYRSTERVVMLDLLAASESWPHRVVERSVELLLTTFDVLTDRMIAAYRETATAMDATRRRAELEVVRMVVDADHADEGRLVEGARALGLPFKGHWFAIAFAIDGSLDNGEPRDPDYDRFEVERFRRRLAASLHATANVVLTGEGLGLQIGLVNARDDRESAVRAIRQCVDAFEGSSRIRLGVGELTDDLARLATSCHQAAGAARAGARARDARVVVHHQDALVDILLDGRPSTSAARVQSRLEPLEAHPYLVDTVRSLLEHDLSQSRAARALFVHVNTIAHRIRKIEELTGYSPVRHQDAVEFALALRWADGA
ncbi:MAG: helix-turn-helix domain-containing protein [Leifsonia sp.]|mgnify:CR=1 FL=1|nr:helix-turn-helix domain-containing protein [Leifsonia sp.]